MRILFRAEASHKRGWGHVMRCASLARELQKRGAQCDFWTDASLPPGLQDLNQVSGPTQADWLVVDHYDLDDAWVSEHRGDAQVLRIHDVPASDGGEWDLYLNQNYGAPQGENVLAGPQFALLREEFRETSWEKRYQFKKVVVSYGGTDPTGETAKALAALKEVGGWHKVWVLGGRPPEIDLPELETLSQPPKVAEVYAQADLALGAGGISHFERAALGLPSLVTTVAANQEPGTLALARDSWVRSLGPSQEVTQATLVEELRNLQSMQTAQIQEWSARLGTLVDGEGACRVAQKMIGSNP